MSNRNILPIPKEADEQIQLFQWAAFNRNRLPGIEWMFHIPNGGSRDEREAARLKAQGVKPGVADIFLPVPRGHWHGLFIELKRRKGGRVSDAQKAFLGEMLRRDYYVAVCYGWTEAAAAICEYYGAALDFGQQLTMGGKHDVFS